MDEKLMKSRFLEQTRCCHSYIRQTRPRLASVLWKSIYLSVIVPKPEATTIAP